MLYKYQCYDHIMIGQNAYSCVLPRPGYNLEKISPPLFFEFFVWNKFEILFFFWHFFLNSFVIPGTRGGTIFSHFLICYCKPWKTYPKFKKLAQTSVSFYPKILRKSQHVLVRLHCEAPPPLGNWQNLLKNAHYLSNSWFASQINRFSRIPCPPPSRYTF